MEHSQIEQEAQSYRDLSVADLNKLIRERKAAIKEEDLSIEELTKQLNNFEQLFDGLEIKNRVSTPSTGQNPQSDLNVQSKQSLSTTTSGVLANIIASRFSKKTKDVDPMPTESIEENGQALGDQLAKTNPNTIKQLCVDTKSLMGTLMTPNASLEELTRASTAIRDNVNSIYQQMQLQTKSAKYKSGKEFDRTIKTLGKDKKLIGDLGTFLQKNAVSLNIRNKVLDEDSRMDFHKLADNVQEFSHNIGKVLKSLINKLSPTSLNIPLNAKG